MSNRIDADLFSCFEPQVCLHFEVMWTFMQSHSSSLMSFLSKHSVNCSIPWFRAQTTIKLLRTSQFPWLSTFLSMSQHPISSTVMIASTHHQLTFLIIEPVTKSQSQISYVTQPPLHPQSYFPAPYRSKLLFAFFSFSSSFSLFLLSTKEKKTIRRTFFRVYNFANGKMFSYRMSTAENLRARVEREKKVNNLRVWQKRQGKMPHKSTTLDRRETFVRRQQMENFSFVESISERKFNF